MDVGYSTKSLVEKLGIKTGSSICILNSEENFANLINPLPLDVTISSELKTDSDMIIYFSLEKTKLQNDFLNLKNNIKKNGIVWVCWPKGGKLNTDLNENIVQKIGLDQGLVDVKVIAIDKNWSGLKFVYRLTDR